MPTANDAACGNVNNWKLLFINLKVDSLM